MAEHAVFRAVRLSGYVLLAVALATNLVLGQPQSDNRSDFRALTLVDQDQRPTSLRTFEGKTLLVNFIFTQCPSACPMQVSRIRAVQQSLASKLRERVQFLSVSIDPARDTPDQLRRYAQVLGADSEHWRFVTASPEVIVQLADALGVVVSRLPNGDPDHSLTVLLFDSMGRVLQRYSGTDLDQERLLREIAQVDHLYGSKAQKK